MGRVGWGMGLGCRLVILVMRRRGRRSRSICSGVGGGGDGGMGSLVGGKGERKGIWIVFRFYTCGNVIPLCRSWS